tara:strand:- start:186 stop:470 length:285 start_codon:yes stop_codon:yes gene_type:complete
MLFKYWSICNGYLIYILDINSCFSDNGACCSHPKSLDQHLPVAIIASSDKALGKLLSYRAYFPRAWAHDASFALLSQILRGPNTLPLGPFIIYL